MAQNNLTKNYKGSGMVSLEQPFDSTFDNCFSAQESKYMVKAVGEILLEIQKYISTVAQSNSGNSSPRRFRCVTNVSSEKRNKFLNNRTLSEDENNACINGINEPTGQTYHRRVLDKVNSKTKKPVDCQKGSLDWNELENLDLSELNKTALEKPAALPQNSLRSRVRVNKPSHGNFYNAGRFQPGISLFVTSFYKHYPIVSASSFVLSLIYIDRFIKSQCAGDLSKLSNFSTLR